MRLTKTLSRRWVISGIVTASVLSVVCGVYFARQTASVQGQATTSQVATSRQDALPGTVRFPPNAPQLSSLEVTTVEQVELPVADPLSGRVGYDESRTSRISSPIAGRVTRLYAEVGDTVQAGKILATLDAPDLSAAQADFQKARADENRKKRAFDRAKLLFDAEVLAGKDYESAIADAAQANAETRRAASRLQNLHATSATTPDGIFSLRTTITGMVTERQLNPGQEVRPDLPTPLYIISDLDHVWVIVDAPEVIAARLHSGLQVIVESDAYSKERFAGIVEKVAPVVDPITRRIQIRCSVGNLSRKLKPEMYVRVSFLPDQGQRKVFALPNGSLYSEGLATFIFVETAPGTFVKRRVSVVRTGADRAYVANGLAAGERVVTEGAFLLSTEVSGDAR